MSRLLQEELKDFLEQKITLSLESRYIIGSISPYLLLANSPAGTFTFKVINKDDVTVWEKSFTSEDIKAKMNTTSGNIRVYFPLVADPYLILGRGEYRLRLEASGYYYNRGSFLGWIKEHETSRNEMDYIPENDGEKTLSYKIKVLKGSIT